MRTGALHLSEIDTKLLGHTASERRRSEPALGLYRRCGDLTRLGRRYFPLALFPNDREHCANRQRVSHLGEKLIDYTVMVDLNLDVSFFVLTTPMMSPRFIRSPGLTLHSIRVPSCMSAPRLGMRNSAMSGHHCFDGRRNSRDLREGCILEMLWIRRRHFDSADSADRRIQIIKCFLLNARADFGRDAATAPAFVHDECSVGTPNGR